MWISSFLDKETAISVMKLKYPHVAGSKVVKIMQDDPPTIQASSMPSASSSSSESQTQIQLAEAEPIESTTTPSTSLDVNNEPVGLSPRNVWTREAVLLLLDQYQENVSEDERSAN